MLSDAQCDGLTEMMVESGLIGSGDQTDPIVEADSVHPHSTANHHGFQSPHQINPLTGCGRNVPLRDFYRSFE